MIVADCAQQDQRLARQVVLRLCSRQGKITALAIAFIIPTKIRKQLEQALLLARARDESKQGGVIAEHTVAHVAQQMVIWQEGSGMIARQQVVMQCQLRTVLSVQY